MDTEVLLLPPLPLAPREKQLVTWDWNRRHCSPGLVAVVTGAVFDRLGVGGREDAEVIVLRRAFGV